MGEMMFRLDNKARFAELCRECDVPVPEDGIVRSRGELDGGSVPFGEMDVILKRLESTINREEEIKIVPRGGEAPASFAARSTRLGSFASMVASRSRGAMSLQ